MWPAKMLHQLTLHICWTDHFRLLCKHSNHYMPHLNCKCFFLLICGLAKCCTYAVPDNIAHLLNRPFLFAQTFTPWSYFFWGGAGFFKTFMLTLKSLYSSLRLQVFLPKSCTYAVPVNIAPLLGKPFLFAMQTFKSLYASLKLQVFFFFANLWPSEMLHLCCSS